MPHLRLARLVGALAVLAVLVPLAGGGSATAVTRPGTHRSASTSAAERALATVDAAFAETGNPLARGNAPTKSGEITIALRDLRLHLRALSGAERRRAEAYLSRPTEAGEFFGASYARAARPTSDCKVAPNKAAITSSHFCIHYPRSGGDAPPLRDRHPHNGIPDQVDKTRNVMNHVWDSIVVDGGYHAPPPDGAEGGRVNRESRFDVYLSDIGDQGLYGYCTPESPRTTPWSNHAATSYCVLDDDYREFPNHTHLENLQVTGAHEFFHSVQFAYDYGDDTYFLENTATWVEDQIYTNINDNRQFLPDSSEEDPNLALDANAARYGNWIWWRYLTEQFPNQGASDLPLLVRHTWENAISTYSINALDETLGDLGTTIPEQLSGFGVASRRPSTGFSEGSAYDTAPLATAAFDLGPGNDTTGPQSRSLKHLTNGTVRFIPDSSYDSAWHLTIDVDAANGIQQPYAAVTSIKNGSATTQMIHLGSDGAGSLTVPFDADTITELTLTNGTQAGDAAGFSYTATSSNA